MRRLSWVLALFPFLLISFCSNQTFAEDTKSSYIVLKGGVYFPQNDDVKDFTDDGIDLEVAIGKFTSKFFMVDLGGELGVGFFQTRFTEGAKVTTKFFPITLNLLGKYPVGPVDIYGGGGMGAYISKTEVTVLEQSDSEVHTFYGFQTLIGGKYNLANDLFFGLEGKYLWTKTPEIILMGVPISDLHYDGFIVTLNIGTNF